MYLTTPIYYVNGRPHIGHVYTTVIADVIARFWRDRMGEDTRLQTGVDEHGQKVLEKATERGMSPKAHCDDMVGAWRQMVEDMRVGEHEFVRTTDPAHVAFVQDILQRLYDEGLIYRANYVGWYSKAAERFWTEKDLKDGKCPDTGLPVERVEEPNYFFRMSLFQSRLIDHIEQHPDFIKPESRRNEMRGYLRKPMGDLCISRPKARMSWGIPIPFDDDYVTYVWFDALLNYISFPGEGTEIDLHVVGKDILTTHAVYWITMLMALEHPLPKTIFAHGWWMSADGAKMSKSLGNAIDVDLLVRCYGVDAVRYYLTRAVTFGNDGRFSYQEFHELYNAELANIFGNLAHRTLTMFDRWVGEWPDQRADHTLLMEELKTTPKHTRAMRELRPHDAIEAAVAQMRRMNKYIDDEKPWVLAKQGDQERLNEVLCALVDALFGVAAILRCVMPDKCEELLSRIGPRYVGDRITVGEPLFPRMKKLPTEIAELF